MNIEIVSKEEEQLRKDLGKRNDFEAMRMRRYLGMPDLSREEGSPIAELVGRILRIPGMAELDTITIPEIVPGEISFDLFNFPPDHPARFASDTYYVDEKNILRTHTTVMWYYYVNQPSVRERLHKKEAVGSLAYGKVYRKDEIDRRHMNVFHQIDGWGLRPKSEKIYTTDDLKEILADIARAIFGDKVEYRFNVDSFPYTDPSCEMEVKKADGSWVEVLGSGLVHPNVLKSLDIDSEIYNGWAFGFGLERLAILNMELPDIRLLWSEDARVKRQLKLGQKYEEVSKYPPITRDVSFVVGKDFVPNNYFDVIRELGGNLVEQVELLDRYEDEKKFGANHVSYTYRIVYRSNERTLVSSEVDVIQNEIYKQTAEQFRAEVR
ncbi:hypothetical protein A3A21_03770 [Candidatus Jorgensenbacteria bacterium RIFCSPLOWO2_01_FULL_45_25b]|uniref:phenylalanine--tRNA ligase n=1 Tax=Candidatus Jorgensenbacteria bacterium RIFCSPLOWO2_01_FULL_45_25b TaxID=1798471 RepID=A0A1F6BXZ5_9BACT|nr:MAG: hypothetical protein A3A21_03770 [Candidatus Jorgensenbacteria bacterium RIFCSPLOWO2_01_FULL_45_25b]